MSDSIPPVIPVSVQPKSGGWLRRIYDKMLVLAEGRHAMWVLGLVSFAEASFFPIPPDPILVAIIISKPKKAWMAAFVCAITSVLGALLGYAIGVGLYDLIGRPIVEFYHVESAFQVFENNIQTWGGWIIVAKGLTPIPFKIVTIASGVAHLNIWTFIVACAFTRFVRFFIVSALFLKFGPAARKLIDDHFNKVVAAAGLLLVFGFVLLLFI